MNFQFTNLRVHSKGLDQSIITGNILNFPIISYFHHLRLYTYVVHLVTIYSSGFAICSKHLESKIASYQSCKLDFFIKFLSLGNNVRDAFEDPDFLADTLGSVVEFSTCIIFIPVYYTKFDFSA